jgi:hypothetical protein
MSLPFLNSALGYDEELRNSVFFERGLHATSICGVVGAAVAVAMLQGAGRGGDRLRRRHRGQHGRRPAARPTAPAGPSSGSTAAVPRTAAWQRPTWPGHGLTGPPTVLEGRFGFLQAFCGDRAHPDAVVNGLGTDWELPRMVFKPYPCNHFTHAGVAPCGCAQGLAPPTSQRSSWARRQARSAHDRRATRGRGTAGLRVPRGVQRPLHGRRGAARRRPRRVPRGLHRRRRP